MVTAYRAGKPACQVEATERLGLVGSVRLIVTQPLKPAPSVGSSFQARTNAPGISRSKKV